jgi:hypothetical protein
LSAFESGVDSVCAVEGPAQPVAFECFRDASLTAAWEQLQDARFQDSGFQI